MEMKPSLLSGCLIRQPLSGCLIRRLTHRALTSARTCHQGCRRHPSFLYRSIVVLLAAFMLSTAASGADSKVSLKISPADSKKVGFSKAAPKPGMNRVTAKTDTQTKQATKTDIPTKPNIVFVLVDDMGWPDIACYGHKFHETPNIDRICDAGMKFTDFYAATPVCSSTRSTIQSGQYSARTGITDFIPGHWRPFEKLDVPKIDLELARAIRTPGDALHKVGYVTGYFGKWHLGDERKNGPQHRGYDVTAKTMPEGFDKWRKSDQPGPKQIDLLTDRTLYFIEQYQDRPFFVTVSHHAVHIPVAGNPDTIAKYQAKPKPADGVNHPVYAAMTDDLDRSIGRILHKLDELDLTNRTIVVFTSDNGGLQKNYVGLGDTVSTNAPLRDEKGSLYEGGIRVPFIVRWPGVVPPGSICSEPATTADLLPTFCEATHAPLPNQIIDGQSLVGLLSGKSDTLKREAIYFHYPHYHHSTPAGAIRVGPWKLIEFFDGSPSELYHLHDDIGESNNLAQKMPERVERMQKQLAKWRSETGARMPTPNPDHDANRASEWWNRRTSKPLDTEAIRIRLQAK